jgi:hypothetical protein
MRRSVLNMVLAAGFVAALAAATFGIAIARGSTC